MRYCPLIIAVGLGFGCGGGGAAEDPDAATGPDGRTVDQADARSNDAGASHLTAAHCPGSGGFAPGTGLYFGGGGTEGRTAISDDGANWVDETTVSRGTMSPGHTRNLIRGVGYGAGVFVAVGGHDNSYISTTCDGRNWRRDVLATNIDGDVADEYDGFLSGVAELGGVFVAAGGAGRRLTSTDYTLTWQETGTWIDGHLRGIAAGNGVFVAVGHTWDAGNTAVIVTSADGQSWQDVVAPGSGLNGVAFGAGAFVAVGNRACVRSTDGNSWVDCGVSLAQDLSPNVSFVNGRFYVQRLGGGWFSSADGATWDGPTDGWLPDRMTEGNGRFVMSRWQRRGYATTFGEWTEVDAENIGGLTFGSVLYAP